MGDPGGTHCPVHTLIDDVLMDIFLFVDPCSSVSNKDSTTDGAALTAWHSIPSVCRRWRHIALTTPKFWASVLLRNPDLTHAMIERSKTHLINVKLRSGHTNNHDSENQILLPIAGHLHRTISIDLSFYDAFMPALSAICHPAPVLRSCILHVDDFAYRSLYLPEDILGQFAPCLETLSFDGCCISWTSRLWHSNITTLTLRRINMMHASEADRMICAFENMPNLRYLDLGSAMHSRDGIMPKVNKKVRLPHLRELRITGIALDILRLAPLFIVPMDTTTHIVIYPQNSVLFIQHEMPVFNDGITHHWSLRCTPLEEGRDPKRQLATLEMRGHRSVVYDIRASTVPIVDIRSLAQARSPNDQLLNATPPGGFSFSVSIIGATRRSYEDRPAKEPIPCDTLLRVFPKQFNFRAVTTFVLGIQERAIMSSWRAMSDALPNIETIVVERRADHLTLIAEGDVGPAAGLGVPFPRLRKLYVVGFKFCDTRGAALDSVAKLELALSHRNAIDKKISVLCLYRCRIARRHLESLQKYVVEPISCT